MRPIHSERRQHGGRVVREQPGGPLGLVRDAGLGLPPCGVARAAVVEGDREVLLGQQRPHMLPPVVRIGLSLQQKQRRSIA